MTKTRLVWHTRDIVRTALSLTAYAAIAVMLAFTGWFAITVLTLTFGSVSGN